MPTLRLHLPLAWLHPHAPSSRARAEAEARTLSKALLACLMALLGAGHAQHAKAADQVWRCSSGPGGSTLYSQQPCASDPKALPASRAPSTQERKEAAAVSAQEQRLARRLSQERRGRERQLAKKPRGATSLTGPVRQVAVGNAGGARQSTRQSTRPLAPHRTRDGHFRAKAPQPPRSTQPTSHAD